MSEQFKPGVVALAVRLDDGHVLATASDFHQNGYGGFSLQEAQEVRAKRLLIGSIFRALCADLISQCGDDYHMEGIIDRLIQDKKLSIVIEHIGHSEDPDQ